jgi:hypothetical protein
MCADSSPRSVRFLAYHLFLFIYSHLMGGGSE